LSNPELYEYMDGIAWHGYAGDPSGMTQDSEIPMEAQLWCWPTQGRRLELN
jgi:O-glycosyl hydrolase